MCSNFRFRNGEELEPSEFTKIESDHHGLHRLIIRKARAEDAGEYRCTTSNIHGSAQCTGKLTYESKLMNHSIIFYFQFIVISFILLTIFLDSIKGDLFPSCESFSSDKNDMYVYECSLCKHKL